MLYFVRLAAASTMELNRRLAGDVGVGQQTAHRWLVLEIGYLAVTCRRRRLRHLACTFWTPGGYLLDIPDDTLARIRCGEIFECSSSLNQEFRPSPPRGADLLLARWHAARRCGTWADRPRRSQIREVPADAVQNLEWWTGLPDNPTIGGLRPRRQDAGFESRDSTCRPGSSADVTQSDRANGACVALDTLFCFR